MREGEMACSRERERGRTGDWERERESY